MILKICDSTDRQRLDYFRWVMDREMPKTKRYEQAQKLVGWLAAKIRRENIIEKDY